MNVELLNRVKELILKEPEAFDMDYFVQETNDSPCGTTQCIGGTTAFLHNPIEFRALILVADGDGVDTDKIEQIATDALDLSTSQADRLFYTGEQKEKTGWPKTFTKRFKRATTEKGRAKVAAARIEHFIKTKGAE